MNAIPCDVIKDLLPSYVDGLTSVATNRMIEEHLEGCESCREAFARMRGPQEAPAGDERGEKEIDFLKKTRKRGRRAVLAGVAGALLLAVLVLCLRVFVIGKADFRDWAAMKLQVEGNRMTFTAVPMDSASAIARLTYTEEDGVVTVRARSVLVNPLYRGSRAGEYTAGTAIREVRLGDRIVWSEGETISPLTSDLFVTRHDYIGDASANSRTAEVLGVGAFLGAFTNKLDTAAEPYGWTILLTDEIPAPRLAQRIADMDAFAPVLLALVGNLDHVTFVYRADGADAQRTYTAAEATAFFGEDIKNAGKDVRALERLLKKADLTGYGRYEAHPEEVNGAVWLRVVNLTETELAGIGMEHFRDGQTQSEAFVCNADESAIKAGEITWASLEPLDFGGSWDDGAMFEIGFSLELPDGTTVDVPERFRLVPAAGVVFEVRLTGSAEGGFRLE